MRYVFGDYSLDLTQYELRHAGRLVPVEPRVFDLLAYLVQQAGQTVPTETLLAHLYPDQFAPVERLTNAVTHARKALGETSQAPRYIQTVRHRGYRFMAPVTVAPRQRWTGRARLRRVHRCRPTPSLGVRHQLPSWQRRPLPPCLPRTPHRNWVLLVWTGQRPSGARSRSSVALSPGRRRSRDSWIPKTSVRCSRSIGRPVPR